uniref:Uncharacterized protein n=1 Tax=Globisporangium ultimum (strain ATCC 200006 / CBS 805.95 / DAOM BR144) TaxID=431595 RepID=K3WIA5_GLOUD
MRANNGAFVKSIGALGQEACTAFMEWCGFQPQVQDGETIFVYTSGPVNRCSTDEEKALLHQRHAAEAHRRIHFLKCFRE